jgi:hypothetical protein
MGDDGQFAYWAESSGGTVTIHRRAIDSDENTEILADWGLETLRLLLLWAEDEKSVTFSLTGPLAQQVKDLSRELSLTPEMFVWHAVKIFIDSAPEA